MKRKLFTILLAIMASIGLTRAGDYGTCGAYLTWSLNEYDSTLVISGVGAMDDWSIEQPAPWNKYKYFLAHVIIDLNVTNIGKYAFFDCLYLLTVDIPLTVTDIGEDAFRNCRMMQRVTISSLTAWCDITFSSSYSNPLSYAHHLFHNGAEITDLIIPDDKKAINDYAFQGCLGLSSVTIPNSVTSIGKRAFESCFNLGSVTIPESVTSIADSVFSGCYSLTSVTIPNSVTSIGEVAFSYVPNIEYSGTASGSPWGARSLNGFVDEWLVYNDASKTKIRACSASANGDLHIPNSVESIEDFAFVLCSGLASVTIPNSVTSIGSYAFALCSSLKSVTIPNSVTSIGDKAFYNCARLKYITNYAITPQTINSDVFEDVYFAGCYLYVQLESIELYKNADVWQNFKSIWPISATQTTTEDDEVNITPEDDSADITWPAVNNAVIYDLTIVDKDGRAICTLRFNKYGQLTSILYNAPSRTQTAAQVTGFTFTVTGLDSGSEYTYSIVAKDAQDQVLDTKEGSFTTSGGVATAVDNASVDTKPVKLLRNGQLFILREGKTYTVQGQEVR